MRPEDILAIPARVLTQAQREAYFDDGYLVVESVVDPVWLERLNAVVDDYVEQSRKLERSDGVLDLEPGHRPDNPRPRRISQPVNHHPIFWEFASQSIIGDVVADVLGPDVKFHHANLNFKWSGGGQEVTWHQDIPFFPHTNYSMLNIGTYLRDVDADMAPLKVIPGSHKGPIHSHYDADDETWTGQIGAADVARLDKDRAVALDGPAGSCTLHHCRTVHASEPNSSSRPRPLLINGFSSADAMPYTAFPRPSKYNGELVRGSAPRYAHIDPEPCRLPPDWSRQAYTSIFALQQDEEWDDSQTGAIEAITATQRAAR
ncbi:MAG: phytanoyl-CoA dioxygenase family protein [Alphaproteobacteria bacterium]